jgi:hypothetical protein
MCEARNICELGGRSLEFGVEVIILVCCASKMHCKRSGIHVLPQKN